MLHLRALRHLAALLFRRGSGKRSGKDSLAKVRALGLHARTQTLQRTQYLEDHSGGSFVPLQYNTLCTRVPLVSLWTQYRYFLRFDYFVVSLLQLGVKKLKPRTTSALSRAARSRPSGLDTGAVSDAGLPPAVKPGKEEVLSDSDSEMTDADTAQTNGENVAPKKSKGGNRSVAGAWFKNRPWLVSVGGTRMKCQVCMDFREKISIPSRARSWVDEGNTRLKLGASFLLFVLL